MSVGEGDTVTGSSGASPDPLRLVRLLWSPDTKVGRSGTTLGAVVEAAIAVADAEGLDAVTMRHLAGRVGVGAMTLYGYVPSRAELIELMVDRAVADTYKGYARPTEIAHWRDALRHIASRNYEHTLTHAWLGEVSSSRPIVGPGHLAKYEEELTPLDGIGLDDLAMDQALTHLLALAHHAGVWRTSMERARATSRLSDSQWWTAVEPHLWSMVRAGSLPVSSRVGHTVASAGDPRGFLDRAVETVVSDIESRVRAGGAAR